VHLLLAPFQTELFVKKKTAAYRAGSSVESPGPGYHDELTSSSVAAKVISRTKTHVDRR
jgi:hypothetical protein